MRTCADDACCEAIHDAVNDKLPPWTKDYDRGASTPTTLPWPWRADTIPGGYCVRDASGQA
jgi:hypothetical protein